MSAADAKTDDAPVVVLTPSVGEAAAEWVSVETLKPWAGNPRKNQKAVSTVAASIERFGFGAPLLARRETGEIIAGHTRLKAAIKLGWPTVPVRYLDLDERRARLLALADNKTGEIAEWDHEALDALLAEFHDDGVDLLTGTGFVESDYALPDLEGPAVHAGGGDERAFTFTVDAEAGDVVDQVFARLHEEHPKDSDAELFMRLVRGEYAIGDAPAPPPEDA